MAGTGIGLLAAGQGALGAGLGSGCLVVGILGCLGSFEECPPGSNGFGSQQHSISSDQMHRWNMRSQEESRQSQQRSHDQSRSYQSAQQLSRFYERQNERGMVDNNINRKRSIRGQKFVEPFAKSNMPSQVSQS